MYRDFDAAVYLASSYVHKQSTRTQKEEAREAQRRQTLLDALGAIATEKKAKRYPGFTVNVVASLDVQRVIIENTTDKWYLDIKTFPAAFEALSYDEGLEKAMVEERHSLLLRGLILPENMTEDDKDFIRNKAAEVEAQRQKLLDIIS